MVCRLAKPDGSNIEGQWNSWPVGAGDSGQKEFTFTVSEPGCSIRLGDHNGVSARIGDFSIEDLGK
jgi:type 1 fimbria pilin